jgi:hypothetical protein
MHKTLFRIILNTVWLVVPSLLWSIVFHQPSLCIDPLFLQAVERKLSLRLALTIRALWALGFSGALLFAWNVTPDSYLFFLREALPFSPPRVIVSVVLTVLLLLWFVLYCGPKGQPPLSSRTLLAVGTLLFVLKSLALSDAAMMNPVQEYVRSPTVGLARMLLDYRKRAMASDATGTPRETFNAFVRRQPTLPPKIVLMVVESWAEEAASLDKVVVALQSDRVRVLDAGFTVYRGSTLSGELRELCSQYVLPSEGLKQRASQLDCAGEFLGGKGYRSVGLHGYERAFYARAAFWRRFGIEKDLFIDEFEGAKRCAGPFVGVCDADLVQRGVELLNREPGMNFVYLLTLTSHEPLDPSVLKQHTNRFSAIKVAHPTQVVTRAAIAGMLDELERRVDRTCTLLYVVGDHQPPSASSAATAVFESNKVPYLALSFDCLDSRQK